MNYYETPSGIKFILNTDPNVNTNPRDLLQQIYENVIWQKFNFSFTLDNTKKTCFKKVLNPYVIKNPIASLNEQIRNELFEAKLDEFIRKSAIF